MKVIFLDRDGVINKYPGHRQYVVSAADFKFLPYSRSAIAKLCGSGFKIFIVSNQAGVGKGVFSQQALAAITAKMLQGIEKAAGKITEVHYCIHHPRANCPCRKPKTGLIDQVKRKYKFTLGKAFFIGDSIRDVQTAHAAGLIAILVLSGREKLANLNHWEDTPDFIFKDLISAVDFILK
jgi:D-glycero-D-manno-heptose 1,7-bisphosphate phosphatase